MTALRNALVEGRIAQAYLFSGIRGVGKTTAARVLAKALNCERGPAADPCNDCVACREITVGADLDVLEVDAATYSKVEQVRDLTESLRYGPARDRYKVVVLDEVHRLSRQAFDALLKIVEEPPPHLVFIFATTEIEAVPATILSRCQEFHFRRVPVETLAAHLETLCRAERITASPSAVRLVARAGEGSVRDAVALLDQLATFGAGSIAEEDAARLLGGLDLALFHRLLAAILAGDGDAVATPRRRRRGRRAGTRGSLRPLPRLLPRRSSPGARRATPRAPRLLPSRAPRPAGGGGRAPAARGEGGRLREPAAPAPSAARRRAAGAAQRGARACRSRSPGCAPPSCPSSIASRSCCAAARCRRPAVALPPARSRAAHRGGTPPDAAAPAPRRRRPPRRPPRATRVSATAVRFRAAVARPPRRTSSAAIALVPEDSSRARCRRAARGGAAPPGARRAPGGGTGAARRRRRAADLSPARATAASTAPSQRPGNRTVLEEALAEVCGPGARWRLLDGDGAPRTLAAEAEPRPRRRRGRSPACRRCSTSSAAPSLPSNAPAQRSDSSMKIRKDP